MFPLDGFIGVDGTLPESGVLQHLVHLNARRFEGHQQGCALGFGWQVPDMLAVQHIDHFADAVPEARALDAG
jgi:hypothetical protein